MAARINDVLVMMGQPKKFFWCGKLGAGLAAKISNNYISCTFLLVIAEAMAMGIRNGIEPKLLQDVIHNSSGQSFMGDHVNPVPGVVPHAPSSNNWRLGFKTQMMIKDIGLGVDAAKQVGKVVAVLNPGSEAIVRVPAPNECAVIQVRKIC